MNQGFSFIWLAGMNPCHVTPDLKVIPFDVVGDVPYLLEDGLHTYVRGQEEIAALTGVRVTSDGQIVIDFNYLSRYYDAAAGEVFADPSLGAGHQDRPGKTKKKDVTGAGHGTDEETTDVPSGEETADSETEVSDIEEQSARTVRQSLAQQAASRKHKLTHKPALPHHCGGVHDR